MRVMFGGKWVCWCFCLLLAVVFIPLARAGALGLVLSGGGARGAYEIGVWKAICELRIDSRITAISGTSVGAINAALFGVVKDPRQCETVWKHSIGSAFVCNTNTVRNVLQSAVDELDRNMQQTGSGKQMDKEVSSTDLLGAVLSTLAASVSQAAVAVSNATTGAERTVGVCDSDKLRKVLNLGLPCQKFPLRPLVYATALNKNNHQKKVFCLGGMEKHGAVERLMASTAIPLVFDNVNIEGDTYVDGGYELMGGDNIPIYPIIRFHPEVDTVIVVYLQPRDRVLRRLNVRNYPRVRLLEIFPSRPIGGVTSIFDVSDPKSSELIELGYHDAKIKLNGIIDSDGIK